MACSTWVCCVRRDSPRLACLSVKTRMREANRSGLPLALDVIPYFIPYSWEEKDGRRGEPEYGLAGPFQVPTPETCRPNYYSNVPGRERYQSCVEFLRWPGLRAPLRS